MSLRRLSNSPYWIACLTLPDGRRTSRSTRTADRRLAQRLADEWQDAADRAREGAFVEIQARKVLNEILTHVGQDPVERETAESFLKRWVAGKTRSTAQRYASIINQFLGGLAAKRALTLDSISHEDVLEFFSAREQEGIAPKTLSLQANVLNAAFSVARKLGLVLSNPVEKALTLRPIRVQSSKRDVFSPKQLKDLVDTAEGDWKTAFLLGYFTGARLSDCCNLKWQNVDLTSGVIDYIPQKTQRHEKRVVVPIHPVLLAHLQSLGCQPIETFLCPSLAAKSTGGKNGLSARFNRLLAAAGIVAPKVEGLGLRDFNKLSFHSLRHSFNSVLANGGVVQETRALLAGHGVAVNRDYTHLELSSLRAAVEKLSFEGYLTKAN